MEKDRSYHESAVMYNEGLAAFAEELSEKIEHAEIRKWCKHVGKQHRFHARRHQLALEKIEAASRPKKAKGEKASAIIVDEQREFAEKQEKQA